jgi:hypothetical protein
MADATDTELPLEAPAGEAGPHATEAFALLGNETRLAILLALWEAYDPHAEDNTVPFSRLFERVDYDDPGSFRYHLRQLKGHFIRQRAEGEGYELRTAGLKFVQVVIAGAGVEDATHDAEVIDHECPFCGARTAISYREGLVVQACTECEGVANGDVPGFLGAVPFDPAGLVDRTPEEVRAASRVAAWRQTQLMFEGLCPACSGPVKSWLDCCPDHDQCGLCEECGLQFAAVARFQCRVCKNHNVSSPKALALFHPEALGFYANHGVSTRVHAHDFERVHRVFDLMDDHEVDVLDEDPPEVAVVVAVEDDEMRLTFDETANVVDVHR